MEAASLRVSNAMGTSFVWTDGDAYGDRGRCSTILCVAVLSPRAIIMIAFYMLVAAIGIIAVGSVALAERAKHRSKPLAKQGK